MCSTLRLPVGELPEPIVRNIVRGEMRAQRVIRMGVPCYVVLCAILAIFLGELAFHPQRVHVKERQSADATAARFGAALRDVSVTAGDGSTAGGRPPDWELTIDIMPPATAQARRGSGFLSASWSLYSCGRGIE